MSDLTIIRCGGRHASVVFEVLSLQSQPRNFFVWDDNPSGVVSSLRAFPSVTELFSCSDDVVQVFICHGDGATRVKLAQEVCGRFSKATFPNVIHPRAFVSPSAKLGVGLFVGPNAVVNANAVIGDFCILNSHSIVEHDSIVGDGCSINPGAVLCGSVTIGSFVTVGANACLRDHVVVADRCVIGMGAAITKNVAPASNNHVGFWGGVPGRFYCKSVDASVNEHIRWCFRKPFSSERFLQYLSPSVRSGHVTNDGPLQGVLEGKIQSLLRTKKSVLLCCNGTAALHALVAGLSLQKGNDSLRWVTQAFTFPSSIQGPLFNSLVVDNDANLFGPSMRELNAKKDLFDGVIVTNVFGFQTKIVEYEKWCRENGKLLVFDNAATPIGTLEDGRCIHDVGDGAIVSLHETKPIGRGEGGVVIVRKDAVKFVHRAMNFGFDTSSLLRLPNRQSSNWRMSDVAAAAVCDHLDFITSENWLQRYESLNKLVVSALTKEDLFLAHPLPKYPTVLSCLFVRLPDGHRDCDHIIEHLHSRGIEAKHYYLPLDDRNACPIAWSLFDNSICLPYHLDVSEKAIIFMIRIVKEALLV